MDWPSSGLSPREEARESGVQPEPWSQGKGPSPYHCPAPHGAERGGSPPGKNFRLAHLVRHRLGTQDRGGEITLGWVEEGGAWARGHWPGLRRPGFGGVGGSSIP